MGNRWIIIAFCALAFKYQSVCCEDVMVGDMRLSKEQYEMVYGTEDGQGSLNSRKAISMKALMWPNGEIPYTIHPSLDKVKSAVYEAIETWMKHTCLKFREVPQTHPEHHVVFTKKNGCWSDVGRKYWHDSQELSVGFGCEGVGKIMHEIGHLIGFYHEHSRPDRDNFIKIFYENMSPSKKENFKKQKLVDDFSIPYDYGSIMHYSTEAFSEHGNKTIMPLDPTQEFVMGQRDHLSFYDIKLANMMYSCTDACKMGDSCVNGGFAVGSKCRCQCPPGYEGAKCENRVPIKTCNAVITAPTNITSPDYPMNYGDSKCIWWIKAPVGQKVKITFHDFDLRKREDDEACYWDSLQLRLVNIFDGLGFCGDELRTLSVKSETEEAVVVYETKMRMNRGFLASVEFS